MPCGERSPSKSKFRRISANGSKYQGTSVAATCGSSKSRSSGYAASSKGELTRLQVAQRIRLVHSQSLVLSFDQTTDVLAHLDPDTDAPDEAPQRPLDSPAKEPSPKVSLAQLSLRIQALVNQLFGLHLLSKEESQKHFGSFLSNETASSTDPGSPERANAGSNGSGHEEISLERHSADLEKLRKIEQKYLKVAI